MSITATVIAHDEEKRIARCLDSLRWVEEIVVVVDNRTTDATAEVARRYTDRVHVRAFEGYALQRQWAQEQATGEWIFWIDCDEVATPALAEEIQRAVATPRFSAYRVPRSDYVFGRWIRHGGWYPQYHLRLYRREGARWERTVHELIRHAGPTGTLRAPVLHYAHARVADWVDKMARYTTLEAREMADTGVHMGVPRMLLEPPLYFGYKYFVQQGFRDGMHGLVLALLMGCYRLLRNVKLWDLQQSRGGPRESPDQLPGGSRPVPE